MMCAWKAYIELLPIWMRNDVDKYGAGALKELRLRVGYPAQLLLNSHSVMLDQIITESDIQFVINTASHYSPWTADTLRNGYITATGGHRIGICGDAVTERGVVKGIRNINMLCMRVARDFKGISAGIDLEEHSILIIGRPGCGKTSLLRDLIRRMSLQTATSVGVVDERCEIFPITQGLHCFDPGPNTDVLSGVEKMQGIEMLLRCMNPAVIAVDEITSQRDCEAVLKAGWCGVRLFATAHAGNPTELLKRPVYQPLISSGLFDTLVVMHSDMRWCVERMTAGCTV